LHTPNLTHRIKFMPPPRITVVGSANMDQTFRADRLPRPGETVFGTDFYQGFGGKGANQAVAAARLGANVAFVGKVGDDDFGRATRKQLVAEGIDVTHLGIDRGRPTGTAAILVDSSGENAIVGVPGANLGLTPENVDDAADLLRNSRILLAPCETMIETLQEAFRIAHAEGVLCLLNPAPARDLPEELLRKVDICLPNETELRQLTGQPTETLEQVAAAATTLQGRGPRTVVVTLGARGALVAGPDGWQHVAGVPVAALDTSGAGDAFCGAFATFLAEGDSIFTAAQRANVVAARSVVHFGTQASFPTRAQLTS
jgi:ribokinase